MQPEIELLDRIKTKDQKALAELMEMYGRLVYHQAVTILRNQTDADDVYQEVFVKVYRYAESCKGTSVKAWISRITFNCCMDLIAKNKKQQQAIESLSAEDSIANSENPQKSSFAELISGYTIDEKEILTMRFVSRLSYAEIAQTTGRAEGSLRNLICKLVKSLRQELVK